MTFNGELLALELSCKFRFGLEAPPRLFLRPSSCSFTNLATARYQYPEDELPSASATAALDWFCLLLPVDRERVAVGRQDKTARQSAAV